MNGAYQARWMCLDKCEGSVVLARQLHIVLMLDTAMSSAPATEADRMAFLRVSVATAEARKAEGASVRRLFPLSVRELDVKNSLKSVLQHHVKLLRKRIVCAWRGPQDI